MTQEIIISREFEILNSADEVVETFELIILKPVQHDEDWMCSFYFTNSPESVQKDIIGIDSFQAFSLALQVAKDEIEGRSKRMKITFLEQDNLWL
jgi:hypothetical protein